MYKDIKNINKKVKKLETCICYRQPTLVSGTNIKTINNESLLGNGNIEITGANINIGTSGQIPFVNETNDDLIYDDGIRYVSNALQVGKDNVFVTHNIKGNLKIEFASSSATHGILFEPLAKSRINWQGNAGTMYMISRGSGMYLGYNSTAEPLATMHIQGSGSTSATTNFLLQNSSGTDLLKVLDDGKINAPNLPTSSAGLSTGDIWNDSGTLKIV
jgi:hypothetical protein